MAQACQWLQNAIDVANHWLSAIPLGGLVLNSTLGWWCADPIAALGIANLAVREGIEA